MTKPVRVIVDPRKFSEYVFRENADHGKDAIFTSLGYAKPHSDDLAAIYRKQGAEKFEKGNSGQEKRTVTVSGSSLRLYCRASANPKEKQPVSEPVG